MAVHTLLNASNAHYNYPVAAKNRPVQPTASVPPAQAVAFNQATIELGLSLSRIACRPWYYGASAKRPGMSRRRQQKDRGWATDPILW